MEAWLVIQLIFAAVAWSFSAREVARSGDLRGFFGREFVRLARRAVRMRGAAGLRTLLPGVEDSPAELLLDVDLEAVTEDEHGLLVDGLIEELKPNTQALRVLATVGTSLGLLGAIATLRSGFLSARVGDLSELGGRALDSAMLGFVTALPCWSALALCKQSWGELRRELNRLPAAVRGAKGLEPQGAEPHA